jgi:hypothetical protein
MHYMYSYVVSSMPLQLGEEFHPFHCQGITGSMYLDTLNHLYIGLKGLYIYFSSRFYTYFIIQYSSRLSSRAGPDLAEC